MNVVLILTDTQCKSMVGAYGNPAVDTPNLDRLCAEGIRFERAYTASPVCTPARGAIFTGLHPQCNGAWANCLAPQRHVPQMGDLLRASGCRAGYSGKWHLDGTHYNGSGKADGGFEPDWWYDRINLLNDLPPAIRALYSQKTTAEDLRREGFQLEHVYGHRVADRAIDFLQRVGPEPFVFVASFDEPHDPWIAPPEYWEHFKPGDLPARPNYAASTEGKPVLQQIHAREIAEFHNHPTWEQLMAKRLKFFGCNRYLDREIGRIIDAVDALHADDTVIIHTTDHGDQLGSHGLHDKGPMMYEETTNVPFIVRMPGGARGVVSHSLVSHVDIMPTVLDLLGRPVPGPLQGVSLAPVFRDPGASVREHLLVSFNRFQVGLFNRGGFFPIRCITDGRYKLSLNLLDRDECYDLQTDPYELNNRIEDAGLAPVRDRLHDALLAELQRIRDPMWTLEWHNRPWRTTRPNPHYLPTQPFKQTAHGFAYDP